MSCPVVSLENNECMLNGMPVACNLIRECDHLTGARHWEYALPDGNTNANIWVLQSDGGWEFNGPDQPNVPPPTLPDYVQPVFADTAPIAKFLAGGASSSPFTGSGASAWPTVPQDDDGDVLIYGGIALAAAAVWMLASQ